MTTTHAFTDDALGDADATELAARIRSGEVSSVEVIDAAITRATRTEPDLHAIAEEGFERARRQADATSGSPNADTRPFAGVPTFIKDMIDVTGHRTRFGSSAFPTARPAALSDPFAQQMFDMGMINLGKTTMPEFGFTPSTEFPDAPATANPWNTARSAGGSSGGSAAMVAAGVVPIAHAADGGGSTRIPASCCGLVGLKPTRGRLIASRTTARQLVAIVVDGVLTRSVSDTIGYITEAERRHRNPRLESVGPIDRPLERKLRIGVIDDAPVAGSIDEGVRREFEASVNLLEGLGHRIDRRAAPVSSEFAEDFVTLYKLLAAAALAADGKAFGPAFEPALATEFTKGLADSVKQVKRRVPGAIRRLRASQRRSDDDFGPCDVIMMPTVAQVPPELGHLGMDLDVDTLFPRVIDWACFTPYANATGTPSISLPLGHDPATNCPVGMTFGARTGQDRLLLELALQLEQAQPWRRITA